MIRYRFLTFWKLLFSEFQQFFRVQGFNEKEFFDRDIAHKKVEYILNNIVDRAPRVTVITPTTGSRHLYHAVESVVNQSFSDVFHLIVTDGEDYSEGVRLAVSGFENKNIGVISLPFNTGRNGMNGHRIYAAMPFLVNSQYILFLDEDNWYREDHVESLVECIEKNNLSWAYSMRNIFTEKGEFVAPDDCESVGSYPPFSGHAPLVDTNCYCFKRAELIRSASYWYHPRKADRYFFYHLKRNSPDFMPTGKYTVNYRLKENKPLFPSFFLEGNSIMLRKYKGKLPWLHFERDSECYGSNAKQA